MREQQCGSPVVGVLMFFLFAGGVAFYFFLFWFLTLLVFG